MDLLQTAQLVLLVNFPQRLRLLFVSSAKLEDTIPSPRRSLVLLVQLVPIKTCWEKASVLIALLVAPSIPLVNQPAIYANPVSTPTPPPRPHAMPAPQEHLLAALH